MQHSTTDYTVTLAGDPDFHGEQRANCSGIAHLDLRNARGALCPLGIVNLSALPDEYTVTEHGIKFNGRGKQHTASVSFSSTNGIPDCDTVVIDNKHSLKLFQ